MAFSDPQTVTVNAVAQTLPRTSSGVNTGGFTKDDGTYALTISHSYGRRTVRTVRLVANKITADPLTAVNKRVSMTARLTVDIPTDGFTIAETKQIVDALTAYLTAGSGSKVTQLLGGEN